MTGKGSGGFICKGETYIGKSPLTMRKEKGDTLIEGKNGGGEKKMAMR